MVEVHLRKRKEMRNAEEDKAKDPGASTDPKAAVTSPKSKTTAENALRITQGARHPHPHGGETVASASVSIELRRCSPGLTVSL